MSDRLNIYVAIDFMAGANENVNNNIYGGTFGSVLRDVPTAFAMTVRSKQNAKETRVVLIIISVQQVRKLGHVLFVNKMLDKCIVQRVCCSWLLC
jgi:tRNA G37 N-methylase TrmD